MRLAGFALWFAPATLLPALHIVPILNVAAERFLYLGVFGLAVLFGLLVDCVLRIERPPVRLVVTVVIAAYLALLSALSAARNPDWRSDEALSRATLSSFPQADSARIRLILTLLEQARYEEARYEAARAIELRPQLEVFPKLRKRAVRAIRALP